MRQSTTSFLWKQRGETPAGGTESFQIRSISSEVSSLIHPIEDFFPGNILRNIQHSIERSRRGGSRCPKHS